MKSSRGLKLIHQNLYLRRAGAYPSMHCVRSRVLPRLFQSNMGPMYFNRLASLFTHSQEVQIVCSSVKHQVSAQLPECTVAIFMFLRNHEYVKICTCHLTSTIKVYELPVTPGGGEVTAQRDGCCLPGGFTVMSAHFSAAFVVIQIKTLYFKNPSQMLFVP